MRYRHKKRGSEYEVIGVGRFQSEDWRNPKIPGGTVYGASVDMCSVVVYKSLEDGQIWVRPVTEFEDGRFERLD